MEKVFYQPIIDEYQDGKVKYLSYFSMNELMPILSEKISSIKGEEYVVDYFITNVANTDTYEVRYLAFPKQDEYIKALFSYKSLMISYLKNNNGYDTFRISDVNKKDNIDYKDVLDIQENNKVFLIAQENISEDQVARYLNCPPVDAYLSDAPGYEYPNGSFFCYDKELDQLSDTIFGFAKKKLR